MQSVCVPQIMSKIIDLNKHNEKKSLLAGDKCDPPQEFDAKGESTRTTRLHDTLSVP